MANPAWLNKYLTMKPDVKKIYDDLDGYREFCIKYGYVFNEGHLYNEKTPWGEYQRVINGKIPKDNWGYAIKGERFIPPARTERRGYHNRHRG